MIRIALIGCHHAPADYGEVISRLQGARLAAAVDPDDATARRTAEALEVPLTAASFENLLRDNADAFDAVAIRRTCGPPEILIEQAAAAGKHVLLDMPLLLRMPLEDVSIAACRSAGMTFMLGQVTRFLPSVAEVKSCLGSGIFGAAGLLRIHDWRAPEPDQGSHGRDARATDTLFQAVLPDVDLANWIFDALPTEVYAAGCHGGLAHPCPEVDRDSDGYVQLHLGYAGGGMALVDCSRGLPPGSNYFSLSVVGSAGAAYADDHHNMHLLYSGGRPTALPAGQGTLHHLAELQEFVDAIETGRPPAITADDGLRAAAVVRAADRSLKSGRAMQLVESCYEPV